jgi:hypothetical protein
MAKNLLDIDRQIQRLRDEIAAGKASLDSMRELDLLIEERFSLLEAMANRTTRESQPE